MSRTVLLFVFSFMSFPAFAQNLTLEDCLRIAGEDNPRVRQSLLSLEDATMNLQQAKADYAVRLSADSSMEFDDKGESSGINADKRFRDGGRLSLSADADYGGTGGEGSVGLSYTRPLWGDGNIADRHKLIRHELLYREAEQTHVALLRDTRLRVVVAWYRYIRENAALRIRELRIRRAERNLELAEEKQNPVDIADAKISLTEARLAMIRAESGLESARDELTELLGRRPGSLDFSSDYTYRDTLPVLAEDIGRALSEHENIRLLELQIERMNLNLIRARLGLRPDVSLSLSAGRGSEDGFDLAERENESVSVSMNWVLGRGAEKAEKVKAENAIKDRELDLKAARLAKRREIRDLHRRLNETNTAVRIEMNRIKLREEQVELYRWKWENGEAGMLEYLRSLDALENARVELVRLQTSHMENLARYRRAIAPQAEGP